MHVRPYRRTFHRIGLSEDEHGLTVAAWPGGLKPQALALYGGPTARRLLGLEGWTVEPRPHLAFWQAPVSQRLQLRPALTLPEYVALFEGEAIALVGRYPRWRDELWPDLLDLGIASPADAERLPWFAEQVGARPADFRAGLRVWRRVTDAELAGAVADLLAVTA